MGAGVVVLHWIIRALIDFDGQVYFYVSISCVVPVLSRPSSDLG